MPDEVAFIFGHTHKPFQEDMNFEGYPQWVNVYNTGGWVVESVEPTPVRGGAVALIDENLDVVSVRMYNEGTYKVSVEEAGHPGEPHSQFFDHIAQIINPGQNPWRAFGEAAERAVSVRAANLKARINRRGR